MHKKRLLQFSCQKCKNPVPFSIFDLDDTRHHITCEHCQKKYAFTDETLKRQLKKFEALCLQLIDSEDILSNTAVGIDVGEHHVKVPYKILLTRLNTTLDLTIGTEPISFTFRVEPLKDLQRNPLT